jgi:hypothetical protein
MNKAKIISYMNVTKRLIDRETGRVKSEKKSSNGIDDNFLFALMRAAAAGIFANDLADSNRVVNRILFNVHGDTIHGRKMSDDSLGVDVIDGGDGSAPVAKFSAYMTTGETVTVNSIELVNVATATTVYAEDDDNQEVTVNDLYEIQWEISVTKTGGAS